MEKFGRKKETQAKRGACRKYINICPLLSGSVSSGGTIASLISIMMTLQAQLPIPNPCIGLVAMLSISTIGLPPTMMSHFSPVERTRAIQRNFVTTTEAADDGTS